MRNSPFFFWSVVVVVVIVSLLRDANAESFRSWTFVDTKSGGFSVLSLEDERLIVAESGIPVQFCSRESGMICFSSEAVSFAIPVDDERRDYWTNGGRVYCVVRRFRDANDSERPEGAWLIYSREGEQCGGHEPYDQVAIFSQSAGLRMIRSSYRNGGFLELWAVDSDGFGSAAGR